VDRRESEGFALSYAPVFTLVRLFTLSRECKNSTSSALLRGLWQVRSRQGRQPIVRLFALSPRISSMVWAQLPALAGGQGAGLINRNVSSEAYAVANHLF
jgi:hypothetical protein